MLIIKLMNGRVYECLRLLYLVDLIQKFQRFFNPILFFSDTNIRFYYYTIKTYYDVYFTTRSGPFIKDEWDFKKIRFPQIRIN
jgi:hypothetical protein